jgi:hypothetical protein
VFAVAEVGQIDHQEEEPVEVEPVVETESVPDFLRKEVPWEWKRLESVARLADLARRDPSLAHLGRSGLL